MCRCRSRAGCASQTAASPPQPARAGGRGAEPPRGGEGAGRGGRRVLRRLGGRKARYGQGTDRAVEPREEPRAAREPSPGAGVPAYRAPPGPSAGREREPPRSAAGPSAASPAEAWRGLWPLRRPGAPTRSAAGLARQQAARGQLVNAAACRVRLPSGLKEFKQNASSVG